jgi:hypothetical protein
MRFPPSVDCIPGIDRCQRPGGIERRWTAHVAVAAGGNFQMSHPLGDALAIFKLSGSRQ